jgi:uncharacterized membrane protein YphA (DoxX/SURF4 family)
MLLATAALVLIGFLTPLVGTLISVEVIGNLIWRPLAPSLTALDEKPFEALLLTMAIAIVLLGPGAFSLDSRLFGRREIIIPPRSHPPKS